MSCQYYPPADLDELEEVATEATVSQQIEALQTIADIFNHHQLPYGLMGGMNFYLRGSGRTTDDVDLAVTGSQSLQTTLDFLDHDERVTRPRNKMSWMGGVARTFVRVGEQQVQIDLKWQKSEGHGMPMDLNAATELRHIIQGHTTAVRFLKIGPLVKAKFQSYGRGKPGDYADLVFICTHPGYREEVREVADEIRMEKRELFVQELLQTRVDGCEDIRSVLRVDGGEEKGTDEAGGESEPDSEQVK